MTREELLADAESRKAEIVAKMDSLQQQAVALNAQGVEQEKLKLGVEGEIKALTALGESIG